MAECLGKVNFGNLDVTINSMGAHICVDRPHPQGEVERNELEGAGKNLTIGKTPGIDDIPTEMLKGGEEAILEWMLWISNLVWEQSEVPEQWKKAIIVPLYKGMGSWSDCNSYRGIKLFIVPEKVYGRVLSERMMKIAEGSIGNEQGGFRIGRGCVDQIFALRMIVEKYLERAYDKAERNGVWDVLRIYGLGGWFLEEIISLYKDVSASV